MHVLPVSTSPRCEAPRTARLTAAVVPHGCLSAGERDQMFGLMRAYYAGVDRAHFEQDLEEKHSVIVLRDRRSARIQGFSTLMRLDVRVDARDIAAFFSGDTIIDREYWGDTVLSRAWGQVVFAEADGLAAAHPGLPVFWFLICSGYKTWRFLPLFFRRFYPNPDGPTPPDCQRVIDALGTSKFGDQYDARSGIVRLRAATPLRAGVADVSDRRLRDPLVRFFTRSNPGHASGDELACLAELSRANLTRSAERMLARPIAD